MINKKKTGLCLALAATLIASSALCGCQQSDSSTSAKFNSDVKDAFLKECYFVQKMQKVIWH